MLDSFKTVRAIGKAEVIIKKSRFIGHARPVNTEEDAHYFINQIKKEHASASHNCSAYIIGERDQFQKQSDDGEPNGTAGRPIMEVIKNKELQNIAVVVTRYFGGIMLGAGGLVRAYTEAAAAGIEAAGVINQVLHQEVIVEVDYTWLGKIENELKQRKMKMGDHVYTDKVTVKCFPIESEADKFVEFMKDLTQGQSQISIGSQIYITRSTDSS